MQIINAKDLKKKKTTALIYGAPGAGKTTALGQLPGKTLLIDIDHSSDVLAGLENVDILQLTNLEDLPKILHKLQSGHKYDNICVDNLTELQNSMLDYMGMVGNNGGQPSIKDYGVVNTKIRSYVRDFRAVNGNILFTAWEVPEKITLQDGTQYNQFMPDLRDKIRNSVCGLCNVVGRVRQNEDGQHFIQLESSNDTYAKDQINKRKWCKTEEVIID